MDVERHPFCGNALLSQKAFTLNAGRLRRRLIQSLRMSASLVWDGLQGAKRKTQQCLAVLRAFAVAPHGTG
jgi:hypothetical protein